jgi:hypothetical protein
MTEITIQTRHNGDKTKCTIKSYQRIENGSIEMYMTKGWYEFHRANNLQKGDKLEFQLSDPPYFVVIDIVRNPIDASATVSD